MTPAPPPSSREHAERTLELARIYRAQRALVRQQLRGFGVRDAALEDALHDVFVIAFRKLASYDHQRGPLRAWLVGIAWRVAAAHRRRHHDHPELRDDEVASDLPDPESYAARSEAKAVLDRLLHSLPPEQAAAFVLAELEGLSGAEIAEQWQIAPATAYTRVARARLKMQAELERHRYGRRPWWAALFWPSSETSGTAIAAAFVSMRVLLGIVAAIVLLGGVAWWLARDDAKTVGAAEQVATPTSDPRARSDRRDSSDDGEDAFGPHARAATISGRVHTATETPIPDADVCVWPEIAEHGGTTPICSKSAANGTYRIAGIPPSRYRVTASAKGYAPGETTVATAHGTSSVALHAGEERRGIDVVLTQGGVELRGLVSDVFGGPVDGARVTVRQYDVGGHLGQPSWGAGVPVHATTAGDGTFHAWVERGKLDLGVRAEGYGDADVIAVVPGPTVTIALLPESTLSGIVVARDTKVPVPGARVVLRAWTETAFHEDTVAFTDEDGRFTVRGLVAGRYRPAAFADGLHGESARSHVLDLGDSVDDVVVEMVAASDFRANILVAPEDTPCPSGSVMLWDRSGEVVRTAAIAPDGVAAFQALTPGEHAVVVACDEHDSAGAPQSVTVGGSAPNEVTWRVQRGKSIRGHVLDPEGKPLAGHVVAYTRSSGPDGSYRWSKIAADGSYAIAGLSPGQYSVNSFTHAPEIVASATIVDRDVELDLTCEATLRVTGKVMRGGEPAGGIEVRARKPSGWFQETTTSSDDGSFTFDAFALGKYRIVAKDELGNHSPEQAVTLAAGREPAEVVLVLPAAKSIRGVVVDEEGSPLRDALVSALASDPTSTEAARRAKLRGATAGGRGTTLTDADGEFELTGVSEDSTYTVVAQRRGGGSASQAGVKVGDHTRLQLAATATISGHVRAATGPTALWIELYADNRLAHRESFVMGSGAFEIADLDAGAYQVRAIAREGRGRAPAIAREGETTNVDLELLPNRTIRGRFVDLEDGSPRADLWATVTEDDATSARVAMAAERAMQSRAPGQLSDADGNFVVPDAPHTTVLLHVMSAGFQSESPDAVMEALLVPESQTDEPIEIAIPRSKFAPFASTTGDLGFDLAQYPLACNETPRVGEIRDAAVAVGLRKGDEIVAIGGHDVTRYRCYLGKTLLTVAEGDQVELTLARGETVRITAAARK